MGRKGERRKRGKEGESEKGRTKPVGDSTSNYSIRSRNILVKGMEEGVW